MNLSNPDNSLVHASPRVSLCTTCMGRLEHLKHTLLENIAVTEDLDIEFVLLNYSSPDFCDEWVRTTLEMEIRSRRLAYYRYDGAVRFHHSHAKNLAHRLARGNIVCNVDADNFIGSGFGCYLAKEFNSQNGVFLRGGRPNEESGGRIAFLKTDFCKLGGYDESMNSGWGYEDWDLITRAKLSNLKEVFIYDPTFLKFITHGDSERVRLSREKIKSDSDNEHRRISFLSVTRGKLIANDGSNWGRGRVIKNFEEEIVV